MTFFASAAGNADTGAQWVGILAGTIASFASTVFFIFLTLLDRWEHHRFWFRNWWAFAFGNAFSVVVFSEITFFASATSDADTRAQGVGVLAGSIASFALTVFFIFTSAHLS